jgi:formate dehydrogenase iron-sulfur subunit
MINPIRIFVPQDAAARSVGADAAARAIAAEAQRRNLDIELVRNGSRGLLWLEPMVEVEVNGVRHAYGPVHPNSVASLFDAGFLSASGEAAKRHPLAHGATEEIDYLKRQQRLTFARVGITDPRSLTDYIEHGGYRGLKAALAMSPAAIVESVTASGLRGRGGAAFPAGIKWKTVLGTPGAQKYVVCNADEGDSGTFSDRMIMEGDPFVLIEGMTIAGLASGADRGYIYLRWEYPDARRALEAAIRAARDANYLGEDIQGSGRRFELEVRVGAGAYICGEETSLLESLEGKRGQVRFKPPLPAVAGLFGKPTVINNVITFASVPLILDRGAEFYKNFGMGRSRGTLPMQLAGNIKHGGLVEVAFGMTLRELLYDFGGGSSSGRPIRAVQVGGPLGAYLPESQFDTAVDYEAFASIKGMLGHGGVVVFDDTVDMAAQARYAMEFCTIESCGKCTPCRIGSVRGVEVIDRLIAGENPAAQEALLRDLCETMLYGSLCAMGGLTPYPVLSALNHFPEDFAKTRSARASA